MAKISIKTIALSTLVASTSTAISTTVSAADEYAELNLGIGRILFGDDLDDANHYHIGLGHTLNDRWTMELVGSRYKADMQDTGMEVEGTQYRLDALYHVGDDQSWRPYIAFGVGDQRRSPAIGESSHDTLINAGLGLKARLARNWEWRTDVRAFNSLDEEHTDIVFSTGISFLFGVKSASAPVREPTPVAYQETDSDGDGVLDSADKCPDTPRRYKVDSDGCPMKLTETVSMNVAVVFDLESAEIKDQYVGEVADLAKFMDQYEDTVVTVEGHTDNTGSEAYNKNLSQRRAESVKNMLVNRFNISNDRVTAVGYGEDRPVADNNTAAGREQNRRVVGSVSTKVTTTETR